MFNVPFLRLVLCVSKLTRNLYLCVLWSICIFSAFVLPSDRKLKIVCWGKGYRLRYEWHGLSCAFRVRGLRPLLLFVGFSAVRFTVILRVRCFVFRGFFLSGRTIVLVVPWDHAFIAVGFACIWKVRETAALPAKPVQSVIKMRYWIPNLRAL
jgi:hypothetical protein